MAEIRETPLPGVGARRDLETQSGRVVGVVAHRTGRRDLVIYERDDPDAAASAVELTAEEGQLLAEMIGGPRVRDDLESLPYHLEGLTIAWLTVAEGSPVVSTTIGESEIRARTDASVVAIVRGDTAIPAPGSDDRLLPGDIAVVVGDRASVERVSELIEFPSEATS